MSKRILSLLAATLVASTAACGGDAGEGDVIDQDTTLSTIQGTDTVSMPVEVTTQDTVMQTTTTTVDTIEGGVLRDTVRP
jgi:hypothetical protein